MRNLVNLCILMAVLTAFKAHALHDRYCRDLERGGYRLGLQSPIELLSSECVICDEATSLEYHNYNRSFETPAIMTNNGYTVNIQLPEQFHATISGGPLMGEEYKAVSIHPHWGHNDSCGSEHIMDNNCFSVELHIVHIRKDLNSVDEAIALGKIAVKGILIQEDPSLTTEHVGLAQITNALRYIQAFNSSVEINSLILSELISNDNCKNRFNYRGSLTTPPYSEGVNWIVCAQAVGIPTAQYLEFLTLQNRAGELIIDNFRELQSKGFRRVCRTYANDNCK